jgi:hypothetical protein
MADIPENPRGAVLAAFDSVNLINGIVAGTGMVNESLADRVSTVERNVGHLNIMIEKDWFVEALIGTEEDDLTAAITDGEAYVAANS